MRYKLLTTTILAATLAALAACAAPAPAPTAQPGGAPAAAPTMELAANPAPTAIPIAEMMAIGVTASGEIKPRRAAELSFQVPGTIVAEVLVEAGAVVDEGQELARLDIRELELRVKQAEAQLAQAQAGYERLLEGATPAEVAAARAQVAQAAAQLRTVQGSVTSENIAAAEANLRSALARQAEVNAGPKQTDLQQVQAALDQARASQEIQRTNLSAAKTNAELQITLAADALRDAQEFYDDVYWSNRRLEQQLAKFDADLPEDLKQLEEQALRNVQAAEARFEQAKLLYEQAKQNEIDGLKSAEAVVRSAEANLQRLLDGATADVRAAVDAQVAQARATLDQLKGEQRAGQVQAAQAGLSAAQAGLAKATADPTAATLAGAIAQVQAAQAGLDQARLNLEKGTLRAPFAGVVAQVNIDPGDPSSGAQLPAIQIVDLSELRVEVSISDTDVARVREGQLAEIRVDAVPDTVFKGEVTYIAPTATVVGNVRTYLVRISITDQAGLRAGMSARVNILLS